MSTLIQYLKVSGRTQAQLAIEVGCSQAAISRFVSGRALPSLRMAKKIERATNGSVRLSDWSIDALDVVAPEPLGQSA